MAYAARSSGPLRAAWAWRDAAFSVPRAMMYARTGRRRRSALQSPAVPYTPAGPTAMQCKAAAFRRSRRATDRASAHAHARVGARCSAVPVVGARNPTQPNPTQPNPTQPNPTQPNPTQPKTILAADGVWAFRVLWVAGRSALRAGSTAACPTCRSHGASSSRASAGRSSALSRRTRRRTLPSIRAARAQWTR